MPTHEETDEFWRDWGRLSPEERQMFRDAVKKFSDDLVSVPHGKFRRSLRVKSMRGADSVFEMTWEGADGRATFEYGAQRTAGDPHIVWRRIGGHEVFGNP